MALSSTGAIHPGKHGWLRLKVATLVRPSTRADALGPERTGGAARLARFSGSDRGGP